MKNINLVVVNTLLLTGCFASGQAPLIYVSEQTFGVEIGGGGATDAASGITLVLGYKSTDIALVPTLATNSNSIPIRGCYNAGHNVSGVANCADGNFSRNTRPTDASKVRAEDDSASEASKAPDPAKTEDELVSFVLDPTETGAAGINTGDSTANQAQSVNDALSVYGSFGSNTTAGGTSKVSFGKVFATGVAAQHLTEGKNLGLRREALASLVKSRVECIKALKEALGEKLISTDLVICGGALPTAKKEKAEQEPETPPTS